MLYLLTTSRVLIQDPILPEIEEIGIELAARALSRPDLFLLRYG
jgi:hypothetical protein